MYYTRLFALVLFAMSASMSAQSDSASAGNGSKNVKITGTAYFGYSMTLGDFQINGPGLHLFQEWPDGPWWIDACKVGAACKLSLTPASTSVFLHCCGSYSNGTAAGVHAPYLEPHLTYTATAFYPGGEILSMHVNLKGTVTGYQLVNCVDGNCDIGPALFTVRITGHGTGEAQLSPALEDIAVGVPVTGISMSYSGVAHVEDNP